MSQTSETRHQAPTQQASGQFFGISVWSSMSILAAALITGLLITLSTGVIGWPFLALFAIFAIVFTLLTEPRGLFLMVASIPLLYAIAVLATGWFLVQANTADGAPIRRSQVITAAYPLTQHFPLLIAVTLGAALIAVARVMLLRRGEKRITNVNASNRMRQTEANNRSRSAARKARAQAQRNRGEATGSKVTVDELMRRNREQPHRPRTPRPSLHDPEQRVPRTYAPRPRSTTAQDAVPHTEQRRPSAERIPQRNQTSQPQPRRIPPERPMPERKLIDPELSRRKTRRFDDDLYS
ncbi:DUF6542 domain-containing protein [Corynebacterium pseudotuberculosis]|uniref:DUF6542 domain-containing protein n=1 Tax=Corynebacterium pseudotuberculosis TaxID=1719 RepID=UPI000265FBFE